MKDVDKIKEISLVMSVAHKLYDAKNIEDGEDKSVNLISMINPKPGSMKYLNSKGECLICQPGEPMYSTAIMTAIEYFNGNDWVEFEFC
jgi:hypothetical protein